jgi:microcystin-dependent protein
MSVTPSITFYDSLGGSITNYKGTPQSLSRYSGYKICAYALKPPGGTEYMQVNFEVSTSSLSKPVGLLIDRVDVSSQASPSSNTDVAVASFTGMLSHFATIKAPPGWLECNGAAVSRTTYSSLFAAIGTTYGVGNGTTTFNLPELRGEFLRGLDSGRGVDTGRALGSSQSSQNLEHAHTQGGSAEQFMVPLGSHYGLVGASSTANSGGSEARPRNVAVLICIKT